MKILLIGPAYPFRGGISNFNEALCKSLQHQGHEVEILSFSLQYPSFLFPGKTQVDERSGPPEGIIIHSLVNSINPFNWFRTSRFIKKNSPELIILQFWMPFMAMSYGSILRLAGKGNTKTIALCHNVIPHESHFGARFLTRYLLNKCDGFLVLSKSVLQELDQLKIIGKKTFHPHPLYNIYGEKVEKVKAADHFKLPPDGKYLLFFGLIREYKGLDITIRAMSDTRIKKMGIKLIVAGEFYDDKKKYTALVHELGLEDHVIFVEEYIPKNEVAYYFGLVDMVVQTYKTATQSGVTQVAYHFDKPMLVTNVGGLAEIVPHGKVGYVTTKEPADVSDAIVDFYMNNREKEFAPNFVEEKKRFSWESLVRKLIELEAQISPE